ncbi:OmpP1/FadL family transporter [Paracoccus tegillarcae]|uniref:Aromatic hydrocarbon degradation protein n=1 Tax=Paracoccus tegillarcae TaxID=1529068 RepID=A0A2K9EN81_9RHOB|nr:outer membrane protein transport protein [Paracoccus tegillarcae]AUH34917.1 aromatic hydrocarbon degradation protein [Paracoccus tegillarcae]
MKFAFTGAAALLMGTTSVMAGGIERAPQSLNVLFEEGNYAELSFGAVDPTIEGTDVLGAATGDVAQGYGFVGLAYKHQFNANLSAALIIEQPFGADIRYAPFDGTNGSPVLGGTRAIVDSTTYTALMRYKWENNFSVHGGIRGSRASADVTLDGLAYGGPPPTGISGYGVSFDDSWGVGYVAGIAWEKPEIAARVSLTYNSDIEHDFDTTYSLVPGVTANTTVSTPASWTLEGQTGVAADTLVFGSIRWVDWSEFKVMPPGVGPLPSVDLVGLEDTTTFNLGVGRKFTENWSGSASFTYEKAGDDLVSPLAPTNGRKGITLAGIYTQDNLKITTGVNYTKLGDAQPQTADTARASMTDSEAWGVGVRVGYSF